MIKFYSPRNAFGCFSNFSQGTPFTYNNWFCKTSEHAYQAKKYEGTSYDLTILSALTPREAADLGRNKTIPLHSDWEEIKDEVMYEVCLAKFDQNETIRSLLLASGDNELVENSQKDFYWGIGDGSGRNQLGKTLMRVREVLKIKYG